MELVLGVYAEEHPEDEPLICMDEAAKQMTEGLEEPIAVSPGRPAKEDYHYERRGVRAIFMFFNPVQGWRRVSSRGGAPAVGRGLPGCPHGDTGLRQPEHARQGVAV
jgi:hypothetical protein